MQSGESTLVGLLGAVSVRRDGVLAPVAGARARTVLAALALDPGRFRGAAGLIEDIWGDDGPRDPMNALHTQISRLRPLLPDGAIEAGPAGYRLVLDRVAVDLASAEDLAAAAEQAHRAGDHESALELADAASALWRGEAGADLADGELAGRLGRAAEAVAVRLETVRTDAWLAAGRYREALPGLRARCERDLLDEPAHAQLMRCLCGLGRVNEAIALHETLRARLADRLGVDPSEELSRLHLAMLRGEPTQPTRPPESPEPRALEPLAQDSPRPTGLRAGPNPLLGREADVGRLQELLAGNRVVTILGPGGMGKTRLANHLGRSAADGRSVMLVELVGVRRDADVPGAVTAALGLSEFEILPDGIRRGRGRDVREVLRSALSARPTLLILDNCEQVVGACAELVADLVASCPELTVLTTSRTPLQIAAETAYPLPPLWIDENGSPATDLFTARARAVRPSVRLDPVAVARLCQTLDGLPLAIELAAARVRTMSVEQINDRLADRFALLRGADRTSPERHRTLHAVIDWSWDLLAEPERAALRRLSGFPGGFTGAAAAAVAGMAGGSTGTEDALEGLVNQSLLEVTESPAPVGIRYHMLETVREYGQERLSASPAESAEVARLRAHWAAGHAGELFEALTGGDQVSAMALTESEHENLLDTLREAVEGGQAALALPLYAVLGLYWSVRGAHSEAGAWAHRVLEISGEQAALAAAAPTVVLASQIIVAGYLYVSEDLRGAVRARAVVRRVLRADAAAATPAISPSMRLLGEVLLSGNGSGGLRLGRLLARGVRSQDLAERCLAHVLRANSQENAGNRRAARRDTERALELARQRGDRWAEGMASQMLGQLSSQVGHYEEAVGHYRSAGEILWELRAYEESAQVRGVTAAALVGAGRPAAGRAEALAALEVSAVLPPSAAGGERRGSEYEAAVTGALAEADLAEGLVESGLERYRRAVGLCRDEDGGNFVGPYAVLITSAAVCAHVDAGRLGAAQELLQEMLGSEHGASEADSSRQYVDVPVNGAMLMAVAAVEISVAEMAREGPRALGLAVALGARQDYPALRHERWTAAARLALGDAVVDAELRRAARLPRRQALAEVGRELDLCRQALRM